jgi:contact-dependent growth inhibition (CDI) system CdiA-like toxin
VALLGRDLVLLASAYAADGESRRVAVARGRAAVSLLRAGRAEAYASLLPLPERRGRSLTRLTGVLAVAVLVPIGTVLALSLARHIGTTLTPGYFGWLAGQFDALATWWASLNPFQQLVVGFGIAALIALSGGSLGLALGVSGAVTYTAAHSAGAATFVRDPAAATRSWLSTTTPAALAADLIEFGLTFAPSNFAGAAAGRGVRAAIREYAEDPAAFWARRRATLTDTERGSSDLFSGGGHHDPALPASRTHPSNGPDPDAHATGDWEIDPRATATKQEALLIQNRSADVLARAGFRVHRLAQNEAGASPDFTIEGRIFDCYSPRPGTELDAIRTKLRQKIAKGQATRFVVNLDHSHLGPEQLRAYLAEKRPGRLSEVIAIKNEEVFFIVP